MSAHVAARRPRLTTTALVLAGLVAAAAVIATVTAVVVRPGGGSTAATAAPVPPVQGAAAAAQTASGACATMATFVSGLRANVPADSSRAALARAVAQARAASGADSRWIPLLGAIQAVQVSIDQNSGDGAAVGIGVVRDQCAALGTAVP